MATTTATDTGNQFASAWDGNQWNAARTASDIKAVAPDGKNADVDAYRAAWARENGGSYGDINIAPKEALTPVVAPPPTAPAAPDKVFRQYTLHGSLNQNGSGFGGGYGTFNYGDPTPAPGTEQYRDMSEYFANGGYDYMNRYGKSQFQDAWNGVGGM